MADPQTTTSFADWFFDHERGLTLTIAIVGAVTGVFGAAFSLVMAWLDARRRAHEDEPVVQVKALLGEILPGNLLMTTNTADFRANFFPVIDVVNKSLFPVYVDSVQIGISVMNSKDSAVAPITWDTQPNATMPVKLKRGQVPRFYARGMDTRQLIGPGAHRAVVKITTGETFYGNSDAFDKLHAIYKSLPRSPEGIA
ncbi:MAG: hypothetical protein KF805_06005, partial [Phycisphaeraceae bacterium]|nr:hypothetical protein [Phycisphaeraceae bacterium]